jgi:hypothetical protein
MKNIKFSIYLNIITQLLISIFALAFFFFRISNPQHFVMPDRPPIGNDGWIRTPWYLKYDLLGKYLLIIGVTALLSGFLLLVKKNREELPAFYLVF